MRADEQLQTKCQRGAKKKKKTKIQNIVTMTTMVPLTWLLYFIKCAMCAWRFMHNIIILCIRRDKILEVSILLNCHASRGKHDNKTIIIALFNIILYAGYAVVECRPLSSDNQILFSPQSVFFRYQNQKFSPIW